MSKSHNKRRISKLAEALNNLGGSHIGCPECGNCYCWKNSSAAFYHDKHCPSSMGFPFVEPEKLRHALTFSASSSHIHDEETIECAREAAAEELAEYCGACGHGGSYMYNLGFDLDAASGREPARWKTEILRDLKESKQRKRQQYLLKNSKN